MRDGSALGAPAAFDLGTVGGADLLRIPTGGIEAGRLADLVALDLDDLSLHPVTTLEQQIVHSMQPTAIARVMVGGRVVAENGELTGVPRAEIRKRVASAVSEWEPS